MLENFKELHALVERQISEKLKCVRSDNGGECRGPFDAYYKQHGIAHENTHPKTPQLNGLAEMISRMLIERVRCMLSEAKFLNHNRGEALYTVVHVLNLTTIVALNR